MPIQQAKLALWYLVHWYGEARWWMSGGACAGYYWALRVSCNICGLDWYKRPTAPVFNFVGRIRW